MAVCNGATQASELRHFVRFVNFVSTHRGVYGRARQTDHPQNGRQKIALEVSTAGKFAAKSTAWEESRVFLEGDKLEVAVVNCRWVLTHLPAGPRPPAQPVRHYFGIE